jgi:hypothetical protein
MGGKLFDQPRMARLDYLEREAEIRRFLDDRIPGEYRIPRSYGDKADFGDMDILVASRPDWSELRQTFTAELGVSRVKAVGHVYSMLYRGLQTDFFAVPARFLDVQYDFMSFNDVGNFIGRMCRRFELTWGERGLAHVYRRSGGNYRADLELTRDFARVCAFLGLDHARWVAGFETLESVFDWVIESPYFSVAPYLDARGDLARRTQVRTSVQRFVDYLRQRGVDRRFAFAERSSYLDHVIGFFAEADRAGLIADEQAAEARADTIASKFSGRRVMALVPGLVGEPLGLFIRELRASFPDFDGWVLTTPQEEIDRAIVEAARAPRVDP